MEAISVVQAADAVAYDHIMTVVDTVFHDAIFHQHLIIPQLTLVEADWISIDNFPYDQRNDHECEDFQSLSKLSHSQFFVDAFGFLFRIVPNHNVVQKVLRMSLWPKMLYLIHYPPTKGHPGVRKMYDSVNDQLYWPGLYGDVENYVSNYRKCVVTRWKLLKNNTLLKLFTSTGSLQYITMDPLEPFPKTTIGKTIILSITFRYSKFAQVVVLKSTNDHNNPEAVLHVGFFPFVIPNSILTVNGTQFVVEFFQYICAALCEKRVGKTANHPERNFKTKRCNRTLFPASRSTKTTTTATGTSTFNGYVCLNPTGPQNDEAPITQPHGHVEAPWCDTRNHHWTSFRPHVRTNKDKESSHRSPKATFQGLQKS